ncbi:hypothetical protein ACS0TY_019050 [Phlomoides rotata]
MHFWPDGKSHADRKFEKKMQFYERPFIILGPVNSIPKFEGFWNPASISYCLHLLFDLVYWLSQPGYLNFSSNIHVHSLMGLNLVSLVLEAIRRRTLVVFVFVFGFAILWWNKYVLGRLRSPRRFSLLDSMPGQIRSLHDLVYANDDDCKDALRMDRAAFGGLCDLLQTIGGLRNSKYVSVQEKVAMFFSILAHHTKNRSIKFQFKRSGHTVSKYFHSVLQCVCKLHLLFLVEPEPIPDDNTDPRWQDFKTSLLSAVSKMDGSGSGGLGDGEKGKNVRSRRSWMKIEEDALVLCLI